MKPMTCETDRLRALLDGRLIEQDREQLTRHLEECEACVLELERLAATPTQWHEAERYLRESPTHSSAPSKRSTSDNGQQHDPAALPFMIRRVVSMLDPTDDPNSMGRLGGYEVLGVVGSGAMGVVLKAFDPTLARVVALKVMNPTLATCGTARYRFAQEAKAAAGVLHPNVIAIHSVSTERELPYLVMPYVAGTSLQQRLDRQGPLELVDILRIASHIAAGLAAAHDKGLIHRDIKPANIMLDAGVENAVITDFGLARTIDDATMTRSGSIAGTPEYMSPEQARGDSVSSASDVFSLASLMYVLCTGHRPFRAKTTFGVLRKITDDTPSSIRELNPAIPKWLCKLIEMMHAKSPTDRPSSLVVRNHLSSCLAHVYQPDVNPLPPILANTGTTNPRFQSQSLLLGAIIMTAFVLGAIALITTQLYQDDARLPAHSSQLAEDSDKPPTIDSTIFKTLHLKFPDDSRQGKLIIDIQRGALEVEGYDGTEVIIEILTPSGFEVPPKDHPKHSKLKPIFTPNYDLSSDSDQNTLEFDSYNQDYVLNLRIKVPFRTDLTLDSYMDGDIQVSNVSGVSRVHSQHSNISLLDISGSASAYTRNGRLKIRFRTIASDADLDFESYNGDIDLTVPETTKLTTAIYSGNSNTLTAFDIDSISDADRPDSILKKVGSNADEYRFGEINGGGTPLRLESEKGQIIIRKQGEVTR